MKDLDGHIAFQVAIKLEPRVKKALLPFRRRKGRKADIKCGSRQYTYGRRVRRREGSGIGWW